MPILSIFSPAFTSSLVVTVTILGNGVNEQSVPVTQWQSTTSPGQRVGVTLAAGDNTIVPPQSPQQVPQHLIFVMPPGSSLTFKGVAGDTGYTLGAPANGVLIIPLGAGIGPGGFTGSFILNSPVQVATTMYFL